MFCSRRNICSFILFVAGLLVGIVGQASAGPCAIELQKPGSPVTIDGSHGSGEWAQAGQISSTDGCLDQVQELKTGRTYDITVYSQRYDQGGTEYLGFLFVVPDATTQDASNPSQSTTEQIYIYFDPNRSEGTKVSIGSAGSSGTDYRLKLEHQWASQPTGGLQSTLEWATPTSSATCPQNAFQSVSLPSNATEAVAQRSPGAGYAAEVRIPVSAIGNPGSDIGIAFAVVDDQGTHQVSSVVTDKYAASFPAALPSSNSDSPASPCPGDYHMPENYGVGLWTSTAGDVAISRQPVFWNSEDIRALQCGEMTTYTYYSDAPCELTLKATIHNSRPVDLVRHVLYVWADHGASPSNWRFVDLQQTTVAAGGNQTVTSAVWDQVPSGLAHHPCVRAYILPQNLDQGGWSASRLRNVSSNADLSSMMSAYGLSTANWAQKNISASSTTNRCPSAECRIEGQGASGGALLPGSGGGSGPIFVGLLLALILGIAWMGARHRPWRRTRRALGLILLLVVLGAAVACSAIDDIIDEVRNGDQVRVLMSPSEYQRFRADNAIVQMQAFGFIPVKNPKPESANFYDVMGGVFRLVPAEKIQEQGRNGVPVELQVSNTNDKPRRVLLQVESVLPAPMQADTLEYDLSYHPESDEPVVLEPGETKTLQGDLVLQSARGPRLDAESESE